LIVHGGFQAQITQAQAAAVIISTVIGVGVLHLPQLAARTALSAAPMATFIALTLSFVGLTILSLLSMRFPRQTLIEYSELIVGRWAARAANTLIIVFFIILTAYTAREFGSVVIVSVLRDTPLQMTVLIMLLLAALSARHDIRTFAHIHLFYTPIILAPALLITLFSMSNSNLLYLQPIFIYDNKQFLPGILTMAALFQGSFVYSIIVPNMREPQQALRSSSWGFGIAGLLYLIIVTVIISVFGPRETALMVWPTLELAKTAALPANVLERLDAPFLALWVIAVFTTLLSSYYLAIHMLSKMLRLADQRMLTFTLLPLIFVLAMLPQNIVQLYQIIEVIGIIGLVLTIGYPLILLLIAVIRKMRGDANEDDQNAAAIS